MEKTTGEADIQENRLKELSPDLLNTLLKDHTTSKEGKQCNIFWATSDYEPLGKGYEYGSQILPELITGENGHVVMPRVLKHRDTQSTRSREMAEVFTPSWICNTQNNLIDEAWFGRKDVFNHEVTAEDGTHTWEVNPDKIAFPEGRTWKDYVRENRLEITCGEAPYLVSRYDTTTGTFIPVEKRIGLLDRKLRIVSENTATTREWLEAAKDAYRSIYAYEWQGDSLLLAREALLLSFIEYYRNKFGKDPQIKSINHIAYIISWNVWQMDGLKGVVPDSCGERVRMEPSLFGTIERREPCEGCLKNDLTKHNGIYCIIKDWRATDKATGKKGKRIRFIDLINEET
jgi:hypothetical protein